METFSSLLAICVGNSLVPGEFPAQRPVTRSFDIFFDLHPNKRHRNGFAGLIEFMMYFREIPHIVAVLGPDSI